MPECLVKICEMLVAEKKMDEAKGIFIRNKLTVADFENAFVNVKDIGE
jgi:hypothetical protein